MTRTGPRPLAFAGRIATWWSGLALLACAPVEPEQLALDDDDATTGAAAAEFDGVDPPDAWARAVAPRPDRDRRVTPAATARPSPARTCAAYCQVFDAACGDGATWTTLDDCEARCHDALHDEPAALACRTAWLDDGAEPACIAASLDSPICDAPAS